MTAKVAGQIQTRMMDKGHKVSIALGLGNITELLLYHQPTFFLVEQNLIEKFV